MHQFKVSSPEHPFSLVYVLYDAIEIYIYYMAP